MKNRVGFFPVVFLAFVAAVCVFHQALPVFGEEVGTEYPWSLSVGAGWKDMEGDEEVQDSGFMTFQVEYDYSPRWTFMGVLGYYPSLKGNTRIDWTTGDVINRLEEKTGGVGVGVRSTSAFGLSLEGLFHLTRWKRFDPYFVAGGGLMFYADDFTDGGGVDPTVNAGAGFLYHFNDAWAVRADMRAFLAGVGAIEANSLINVGVVWTIGAGVGPDMAVVGWPNDSDGDGLTNAEEDALDTDPQNPDTDGDDLTDFEEVRQYKTNPLEADTDMDLLKDGEEVHRHRTDPLIADTDKGGVSDGHESLEDGTDPLNGADDLLLFSLDIEFETDKAAIKPEYFRDLDVIGKVLARNPNSTALIEGHADKRKKSEAVYNQRLSERRARSVQQYLHAKWEIDDGRMKSKGYGFSRPVAPNDPVTGNPKNRRVDIYIEGAEKDAGSPAAARGADAVQDAGIEEEAAPLSGAGASPARPVNDEDTK